MELNTKMRGLDECLCSYVLEKDPTRKSSSKSVFMSKKELETFYGKIYNKANQDLKLEQKKSIINQDGNKVLEKQDQRIRQKIYNRTFYRKGESASQNLSNKENIKMNQKPIITDNSFKASKLIKGKSDSKFLALANEELLMSEYLDKNQELRERRKKVLSQGTSFLKQKTHSKNFLRDWNNMNKSKVLIQQANLDEGMPHRKAQLIELYQKLYEQFAKQKANTRSSKSHIESELSNGFISLKSQMIKTRKNSLKSTTIPIKRVLMKL